MLQDPKVRQGLLARLVLKEQPVRSDRLVLQVRLDRLVLQVLKDRQGKSVLKVLRE